MGLEWMPRDDELKDHGVGGEQFWGTHDEPPCTVYEKKPLRRPGRRAWSTVSTPPGSPSTTRRQYNSYTTEMVKGVIAGFANASLDRSVVAVVFTGAGDRAFCTGGNTKEYAEYYARRPNEYGEYMDLFNGMVDAILNCKKPTICRVNGMRVAGGQEIGMACDLAVASDLAIFGQAGPEARLGARRRLDRLPALVPVDRGRDVELHLLRDVVGLQDEAQGPDHQGGAGARRTTTSSSATRWSSPTATSTTARSSTAR